MTVFITNGNFTVADAAIKTGSTIKLSIMDLFGNTSPSCSVNLLAAPAVDLLENTVYNIGQNVTLSTAAPNVKIYYNVRPLSEASDAFDNATKVEYTAPFAINENSKVIARVTKDNIVTSNVLLKKFKVKLPVPKFGIEYTPAYGAKMIPPAGIDNVKVMFKTSEAPAANPAEYTAIQTVTADNMTFTAYATVDKDNTAAATRKYENSDSVTSEPYRKAADMSAVKVYQKTNENKLALRNVTSAMEYSLSGTAQTAAPDGTWQTGTGAEIDLSAMESGKYIVVRDKNIPQLVRGMGRMYPALTNGIDAANTSNRWAINILEKKIRLTSINLGGQTVDSTNFKVYVTFKESGSANWIVINDRRNVDAPALGAPLYGMAARTGGYPVGTNIAPGEMAGVVMYTENKMSYYANEETGIFLINDNANGSDNANSADDIFCNASAAYTVKSPLDASKIYASGIDNKIYYQSALNGGSNSDYRLVSKIANNSTGTSYYRSKNALNALNDSMIITDAGVFEKLSGNDVLGFGNNTSLVYALEDSGRNTSPETRDGNIPSTPTADDLLKLGLEYKDASYLTLKNTNGPFSMASIALIVTPNNGADWYELGNIDAMNTALTPVTVPDSALIPIAKYSTASIIKYCYKHSTSGNISAVSAQDGEVVAATKFGSSLPVETGNPAPIPVYFSGSGVKVLNNISNVNTNLLTYTKVNNGSAVLEFGRVNFEKDATGTVVDMKIMIPAGALSNNESGWALKAHTDYNNIVSVSGGHVPASSMNLDAKFSREWGRLGTEAVNGTNGSVYAVAAHNNNIYVGGSFTTAGGISASRIAKWDGSNWSALGSGMNGVVYALAFDGSGNLYVGGSFTTAGGISASRIAKWDGSNWSALGDGIDGMVYALAFDGSGNLYAGGAFTEAGGIAAKYIAKWNGTTWSALGTGMNNTVFTLAVSGTSLYAGGAFTEAGGNAASYMAKWNGTTWSVLGTGMNNVVNAVAVDGSGNLYAGGNFTMAGGIAASHVAKWDGSNWSALGLGLNQQVNAVAVDGTTLYAGGYFTGVPATGNSKYINKCNLSDSTWSGFLDSGLNNAVNVMKLDSKGYLYIGGNFSGVQSGSPAFSRIVRY